MSRQLQLWPLEPASESAREFWRAQGAELRDFCSVELGLPHMRAAELLGLEPRQLFEAQRGNVGFVLNDAKAILREALK